MKRLLLSVLAFSILLFAGCSKRLPFEPVGPEDTMLVGRIRLEVRGVKNVSDLPTLNVQREGNIGLTFRHIEEDKQYIVVSKSGGLFYKTHLEPGLYSLVKLEIKVTGDHGYRTLGATIRSPKYTFQVEQGKVVNLGCLFWSVDDPGTEIFQEAPPEVLRDFLTSQFPESAWLSREWVDVII